MSDFTWLAPAGLWAAAALPLIVLLYFLKLKRRRVIISSTLLWKRAVNDARANAPLQRLRTNLLLLLQLLLALLVALALGRPAFMASGKAPTSTVIILDASASMAATDVSPSRFAAAQEKARERIGSLSGNAEAMVLIAGPRPRVAATFGRDRKRLNQAIRDARPLAAPSDLGGAIKLALAASEGRSDREIVVISDGTFDPPQGVKLDDVPLVYEEVGESGGNTGLVALDIRMLPGGGRQGFFTVTNDADDPIAVEVEIRLDDTLLDVRPLSIEPHGEVSDVFGLDAGASGIVEVHVTPGGTLAADDSAYVALPARGDLTIALGGPYPRLFRRALEADERFEVTDIEPEAATTAAANHDIVVLHQNVPPILTAGRWLLIDPRDGGGLFQVGKPIENPGFVDVDAQHPVARWAGLSLVHVGRVRRVAPPPTAQIIAETEDGGPLLWTYSGGGVRLVVWSGEVFASDLPLRPAFPILLANSIDWLCSGCGTGARAVRAGGVFRGEVPVGVNEVSIVDPEGKSTVVPVSDGEFLFDGTGSIGIYKIQQAGTEGDTMRFAVNLLSRNESDTQPRHEIKLGSGATAATVGAGQEAPRRRSFWRVLVILAAVVLTIEWFVWIMREGLRRRRRRTAPA